MSKSLTQFLLEALSNQKACAAEGAGIMSLLGEVDNTIERQVLFEIRAGNFCRCIHPSSAHSDEDSLCYKCQQCKGFSPYAAA